jgi:small subunit ribosomal protein S8
MITTDPIADMLTRIRNARGAGMSQVSIPYSRIKHQIADILAKSGYVSGVKVGKNGAFQVLELGIDGSGVKRPLQKLMRVSKPGRRVYAKRDEIPHVLSGRGIVIVSTSSGLMTGQEARQKGLGGELICKVW